MTTNLILPADQVEPVARALFGAIDSDDGPTDEQLQLFDSVAELTVDPDARFAALRNRYETDQALRMDGTVFNVFRGHVETV